MNRKTFNSSTLAGTVLVTVLALSPYPALAAAPDTEASARQPDQSSCRIARMLRRMR
jgi:hypothetical protein